MKIAIPTKNNMIDNHFGHCDSFTIVELDSEKKILKMEKLGTPVECGCKSSLAGDLQKIGIELLLAGGIGDGAIKKLKAHQIEVVANLSGTIEEVIETWKSGNYSREFKICTEHESCSK